MKNAFWKHRRGIFSSWVRRRRLHNGFGREAGEDILDVKNSMHTEAEWQECTQHARGVSNCPLCQVYQMDRMRRLEK